MNTKQHLVIIGLLFAFEVRSQSILLSIDRDDVCSKVPTNCEELSKKVHSFWQLPGKFDLWARNIII
jgi:hypothetical protein